MLPPLTMSTGLSLPAQCAQALLNAVGGRPWTIAHGSCEEIVDAHDDSEAEVDQEEGAPPTQTARAIAFAHGSTLANRTDAALEMEQRQVTLASSDHLSLDAAEHALLQKEEKRVFEPLRRSLAKSHGDLDLSQAAAFSSTLALVHVDESATLAPASPASPAPAAKDERDVDNGPADAESNANAIGTQPAESATPTPLDVAAAALDTFLAETRDAFAGALSALNTIGGAPMQDPFAFARGLDLGFVDGAFSLARHQAAATALKTQAAPYMSRGITRVRAPRAFAGHVVSAAPGPIRVFTAPCLRARRYRDLTTGAGVALGASILGDVVNAPHVLDGAGRLFGAAAAFGTISPVGFKAIFDDGKSVATRNASTLRASMTADAVAHATVARVYCDLLRGWTQAPIDDDTRRNFEEDRRRQLRDQANEREEEFSEAARSALAEAFGDDVGHATVAGLIAPPLPGGHALFGRLLRLGGGALNVGAASALALSLRDRFDEAFALVPGPYERLADARMPIVNGAVGLGQVFDVDRTPGAALAEWMLELL